MVKGGSAERASLAKYRWSTDLPMAQRRLRDASGVGCAPQVVKQAGGGTVCGRHPVRGGLCHSLLAARCGLATPSAGLASRPVARVPQAGDKPPVLTGVADLST